MYVNRPVESLAHRDQTSLRFLPESAALATEYDVAICPKSVPMLPSVLDMLTIVFLPLFATSGTKACATSAGPTTFVRKPVVRSSAVHVKAVSSPPGF